MVLVTHAFGPWDKIKNKLAAITGSDHRPHYNARNPTPSLLLAVITRYPKVLPA